MRITFLMLIFFISFHSSSANQIDELRNDDDVERFLKQHNPDLADFMVVSMDMLYTDSVSRKIADSLLIRPWQKTDFDGNGLSDIIVYGIWKGESYLLAVIDEGSKYDFSFLSRGLYLNTAFATLTNISNQVVLILRQGCDFCPGNKIIKTDSLIYKYGDFVEINFSPVIYNILKIEYSTIECFGKCPVFNIEINADQSSKYNAIRYNQLEGKYIAKIDSVRFNEIITLLNYIDFTKLKESYTAPWTDDQTFYLNIIYNDGQAKSITDYGGIGTHGLRLVYEKIWGLRDNQKWKKY